MKILLIHRFYYPDSPPYAKILDDMRKFFLDNGNDVNVLSSIPSYKKVDYAKQSKFITKTADNSVIYRMPVLKLKNESINKLFNFVWFPIAVFFFLLFSKKYDVVTVSTNPPVLLAFFVACATKLKKNKLIYHCMDIHPEIGKISGEFKNKIIFKTLLLMDNFTCKTASKIVVLSTDMKESLNHRGLNLEHKVYVINNYDLSDEEKSKDRYFPIDGKKRVVFTGNIGRFQKLENLVESIKKYGCIDNIELIFVGEGKNLNKLKELSIGLNCIKFIPHQPVNIARKIIEEADMGIVSLKDEIIKYAYPSKTMTYLAEGTPVFVCVNGESELSNMVKNLNLGETVNPSDLKQIYDLFVKISNTELSFDKKYIIKTFSDKFHKNIFNEKFLRLLNKYKELNEK